MTQPEARLEEKQIEEILVAGIRMRGKYADCGPAFARLGKSLGRHICGKPLLLIYDREYKAQGADLEACMPVRQAREFEGIRFHTLPGGRFLTLLHQGPYDELAGAYEQITRYLGEKNIEPGSPCREVYLKGPGMIFRGNPRKYLTEIQFPLDK